MFCLFRYDLLMVFPQDNLPFLQYIESKYFIFLVRRSKTGKTFDEIEATAKEDPSVP